MTEPIKVYTHCFKSGVSYDFWTNYLNQFRTKNYDYEVWWEKIESDLEQEYNCNLVSIMPQPQFLEFQNNDDYVKFMLRWS